MSTYTHVNTITSPGLINIDTKLNPSPYNIGGISLESPFTMYNIPISSFDPNQSLRFIPIRRVEGPGSITSPSMVFPNYESTTSSIQMVPLAPIESVKPSRKVSDSITTSSVSLSSGTIPSFAPAKNINIAGAINHTLRDQLNNPDPEIYRQAVWSLEKRIVMLQGKCPDEIIDNLRVRNFQLDATSMEAYMNGSGLFDHNFQDGIGCLADALIDRNSSVPDEYFKRWITDLNKIGVKSTEGMAFTMKNCVFDDGFKCQSLFVTKVAQDPAYDFLAHEALVGMGAINTLRDKVPNFMHTYAALRCEPPILDNDIVVSWCPRKSAKDNITYLVLENIANATSTNDLSSSLTQDEFLQIYLQIINALNVAYKKFGFTHYDLHGGNVLIQTMPYMISIPLYHPDGSVLYIKTNRLARIIDYGTSHINLQGQDFGNFDLMNYGVYPDSSFPMHDAYKFLLSVYSDSFIVRMKDQSDEIKQGSNITPIVDVIYGFFDERKHDSNLMTAYDRLEQREGDQWTDFFQPSHIHRNRTLDNLILHILRLLNPSFLTKEQPIDAVATICQNNCIDWNTFNQYIFDQNRLPLNIVDYCRVLSSIDRLNNGEYKDEVMKWLTQFNFEQVYDNERDEVITGINNTIEILNEVKLQTVDDSYFNTVIYKNNIFDLVDVITQLDKDITWIICALKGSQEIQNEMKLLSEAMIPINKRLDEFRDIIRYNINEGYKVGIIFDPETIHSHEIILIDPKQN